jgi:Holliday junction resolvase RusA-like endonuclease
MANSLTPLSPTYWSKIMGMKLYKKNILAIRGSFRPVTKVNIDMILKGMKHFQEDPKVDPEQMLRVELFFGFSTKSADIDNPIKATLDLAQKKYGFNDKMVFELNVRKCIVKKGDEFISMGIFKILPF